MKYLILTFSLLLAGCASDCKKYKDALWAVRDDCQSDGYCASHTMSIVDEVMNQPKTRPLMRAHTSHGEFMPAAYFWNQAEKMLEENPNLKCSAGNFGLNCCDPNYVKDCK